MTKHTIEIEVDIPDDLEFDRVGLAEAGEPWITFDGSARGHGITSFNAIILRETWKPPAFFKKGWIAKDYNSRWYWFSQQPSHNMTGWNARAGLILHLDSRFFNFVPPKCNDWTQSLRETPGVEE